jgi:hypothetical protein
LNYRIASLLKQQNIKKNNIYSSKLDDEERMDLLIDSNDQIIEKLVNFKNFHILIYFLYYLSKKNKGNSTR